MEKILVTGATGQLGKEVVELLLKKIDAKNLSVFVWDPSKADSFSKAGVQVFKGDYLDYSSLTVAFSGIDKLYFISSSDLKDRVKQHENVVKAAVQAGVKHIIYTSFQRKNETSSSPIFFLAEPHIVTEQLIKKSGLTYTILKHGLYVDFVPSVLGDKVFETGSIYLPAGDGKAAFTLRSDLAAGAVAIITGKEHENKTYEFSADRTYSFAEIATVLSKVMGKEIQYISPDPQEYKDTLSKAGVPDMYITMFAGFSEAIRQGEFDYQDNTLKNMLGRDCSDLFNFFSKIYKK
jgi:NAD(P)H dehydrogenase (quinone)